MTYKDAIKTFIIILSLWSAILLAQNNESAAVPTASIDSVAVEDSLFYSADSIYYDNINERLYLFGSTNVKYQDSSISSDSLFLSIKDDRAYSYGPTVLQDAEQILIGSDVRFDIESQEGILSNGSSKIDKSYYSGEEVRKTGRDIYDVDNGLFTTCDDIEPCFHFSASQLRIYRGDKIVGKPVIAYVNDFPVFYFPFFTVPIRRGRHPGFLIPEPGYNNNDGKYIKNIAWYYPYKDYADLTLSLDLMEKTGWMLNFESDYLLKYHFNGSLDASYRNDVKGDVVSKDWALRANHHHELGEKSTLDANIDFVTNKRIWEGSSDIDESLVQNLSSSISYRKPLLSSYLNIGSTYTQDLINDRVNLTLPSASFSLPTRPVYELFYKPERSPDTWWSNLSWNYNVRLDHTGFVNKASPTLTEIIWSNELDPVDSVSVITEHHFGINHRIGLSYNWKLMNWLNLRQGIDYNESWYDRDKNGDTWVRGSNYNAYINTNFNLYGIKNFQTGNVRSIRHILSPSIGLSYNPDFRDNLRFYSFSGISNNSSDEAAGLSIGLDQKWQLKTGKPNLDSSIKRLNDILSLSSRISANLFSEDKKFGSISHSLSFRPGTFGIGDVTLNNGSYSFKEIKLSYSSSYSLTQDPYRLKILDPYLRNHTFSHSLGISGNSPYKDYFPHTKNNRFSAWSGSDTLSTVTQPVGNEAGSWTISLSHDLFAPVEPWHPSSQSLRLNTTFKISNNWALSYNNYYDLENKQMISQSFRLIRNLHCWKLDISYTRRNDFWDYRIVLFNTSLPDALKFQTRDSGFGN